MSFQSVKDKAPGGNERNPSRNTGKVEMKPVTNFLRGLGKEKKEMKWIGGDILGNVYLCMTSRFKNFLNCGAWHGSES